MFDKPHGDARQHAPATQRNSKFIIEILQDILPKRGHILEIASGSGEHVVAFAQAIPNLSWQPSDPFLDSRLSIDQWVQASESITIAPALDLDMTTENWQNAVPTAVNAVLSINMIHIAPWKACCGLMAGSGQLLQQGELLYTYGPYKKNGVQTSKSNEDFELWLNSKSQQYGVRDMADVEKQANQNDLKLIEEIEMPANNFSLIFQKQ